MKKSNKVAIKSLTALALTLPGIGTAKAEAQILKPKTDFMYAKYSEGKKRYKIDVYQLMLQTPLNSNWDLTVTAARDVQTGASPAFYVPASYHDAAHPNSVLEEQWSAPSIADNRSNVTAAVRYFEDDSIYKMGFYISEENDYEAKTISFQYQKELNEKNTELTFGYSFSNDRLKPTVQANAVFTPRIHTGYKNSHHFVAGIKQDLSTINLILQNFEYSSEKGYLSDPYKLVSVYEGITYAAGAKLPVIKNLYGVQTDVFSVMLENRPKTRHQFVSNTKFIQYVKPLDSAVHFDYRFAWNSWHIRSHTFTVAYYQPFCEDYEATASYRYYTQNKAKFYAMAFAEVPGAPYPTKMLGKHYSSDYRLSSFGAMTYELGLSRKVVKENSGKIGVTGGLIKRKNSYCWSKKDHPRNPSNNFNTYYVSLNASFEF